MLLSMFFYPMISLRLLLVALLISSQTFSFCGFYVAGAGARLYNNASQVILVRKGLRTVLTMRNDYQGDVQQFAMVVPVPTVLRRDQIRLADSALFTYLDTYSMPRLVEYHDDNPCPYRSREEYKEEATAEGEAPAEENVKIEARYEVGEYDILLLSATESEGLERWLMANGYSIPTGAAAILRPYVQNKLKFFVAKVNLQRFSRSGYTQLTPLQIDYESPRFMLPIRLGMANAKPGETQDLIIYAFTERGRLECTNYRTVEMPTDRNVPTWLTQQYGHFYKAVFAKQWKDHEGKAVFLEYGWNLDGSNYQKCDPCTADPIQLAQLKQAGIFWLQSNNEEEEGSSQPYSGQLYFTRLHVRYSNELYPEDLMFAETPNRENYQVRFIMQHAWTAGGDCAEADRYERELAERRLKELDNVRELTGWETLPESEGDARVRSKGLGYIPAEQVKLAEENRPLSATNQWLRIGLIVAGVLALLIVGPYYFRFIERKRRPKEPNA